MAYIRLENPAGRYEQGDLPRRCRIPDDDLLRFVRMWLQGLSPAYIGRKVRSVTGVELNWRMVRSHGQRLEAQGIIPQGTGSAQPHWRDGMRAPDGPAPIPVVSSDPRASNQVRVANPGDGSAAVKLQWARPGRPRKGQPTGEPEQYPGLTWREIREQRLRKEAAERDAVTEQRKGRGEHGEDAED